MSESRGHSFFRVLVEEDGAIGGGVLVRIARVGRLGSVGVAVNGPLLRSESPDLARRVVESAKSACRQHGLIALIVQPVATQSTVRRLAEAHGFERTPLRPQLGATAVVDLDAPADTLRARMKSKTRYNIRVGLRKGARVTEAGDEGPEVLARLIAATADRQGFTRPTGEEELRAIVDNLRTSPAARIFLVDIDGDVVSGALAIGCAGTVVYKRGGWDGRHGDARPNEVMHDHIIRWASDHDYARYDFDGMDVGAAAAILSGGDAEVSGVSRFKLGFGANPLLRPDPMVWFRRRALRTGHRIVAPLLNGRSEALETWVRRVSA